MENALIFVPEGDDYEAAAARCMEYVASAGYRLDGMVLGEWDTVRQMMMAGQIDVVIVASRDELPEHRSPRIEIVAEETVHRPVRLPEQRGHSPRRRRPRPLA